MTKPKKKPNFLKINDPKLNKIFRWIYATAFAIAAVVLPIVIAELISLGVAKPGQDISSLFPRLEPHIESVVGVFLLVFIAFLTVVIYNYATNKEQYDAQQATAKTDSPLLGAAKEHEQQIIDLMSSVIKPVPGKQTIHQAKTAKFITALTELKLIDANLDRKHLLAWIENVTEYPTCETRVLNQALKAVKVNDPDLLNYKSQLEQIIAQ